MALGRSFISLVQDLEVYLDIHSPLPLPCVRDLARHLCVCSLVFIAPARRLTTYRYSIYLQGTLFGSSDVCCVLGDYFLLFTLNLQPSTHSSPHTSTSTSPSMNHSRRAHILYQGHFNPAVKHSHRTK
jgi:hypothetical protein